MSLAILYNLNKNTYVVLIAFFSFVFSSLRLVPQFWYLRQVNFGIEFGDFEILRINIHIVFHNISFPFPSCGATLLDLGITDTQYEFNKFEIPLDDTYLIVSFVRRKFIIFYYVFDMVSICTAKCSFQTRNGPNLFDSESRTHENDNSGSQSWIHRKRFLIWPWFKPLKWKFCPERRQIWHRQSNQILK